MDEAFEHVAAATADEEGEPSEGLFEEAVADKGYHSNESLLELGDRGLRTQVSEPARGRRKWKGKAEAQRAVYANRRRVKSKRGKRLQRERGEKLERSNAHMYETGGMRRTHLRGRGNIFKRLIVHAAGFNLGLLMRDLIGIGKPRTLQDARGGLLAALRALMKRWRALIAAWIALLAAWPVPRRDPSRWSEMRLAT